MNNIGSDITVYILLPVYNGEKYLLEQLMSIYYQNYTNWYLIVINDGSTDNTESIVENFIINYQLKDKVELIVKKNGGVNSAINLGLEKLKDITNRKEYDLVALCDGDDIWMRNKLSIQVEYMITHKNCDLSFHDIITINEYNNLINDSFYHNGICWLTIDIYNTSFWELSIRNHIISTGIMFRIKYISEIYPLPCGYGLYQDYWIVCVLSIMGKSIQFVDKRLGCYRHGHDSLMQKASKTSITRRFKGFLNQFIFLQKKFPEKDLSYIISYYKDRIKWYEKGYSRFRLYIMILIKYPKIFFFLFKNSIKYFYRTILYKIHYIF